jgi:hypothetical protein
MDPVAVGTAGSAGQVGPCTLGRARGARKAVGSPKREEHGAQKEHVVRVAWHVRWAVCTRVDVGEDVRVAQQAGAAAGEVGTRTRARADHEEEESWTRVPGRGEGNAGAPVGAGHNPDMAHDGQTLVVGCGAADGVADGEEAAESGNGALDGRRGERVDDEDDAAVGVGVVVVVDDYEVAVVVAPVAGLVVADVVAAAAGLAAVAVYALRALQRENFEGGQLRS